VAPAVATPAAAKLAAVVPAVSLAVVAPGAVRSGATALAVAPPAVVALVAGAALVAVRAAVLALHRPAVRAAVRPAAERVAAEPPTGRASHAARMAAAGRRATAAGT
jgi:hypothetical protein